MTTPTLVMLAGLPGTGKSTLALALAQELGWPIIDKDIINTVTLTMLPARDDAALLAYEVAFCLTLDLVLRQKQSVILDTAGRQPFVLERCIDITQRASATLKVIWCTAPSDLRTARLAGRVPSPSQWPSNQASDDDQTAWYAHLPAGALALSTDATPDDVIRRALASFRR